MGRKCAKTDFDVLVSSLVKTRNTSFSVLTNGNCSCRSVPGVQTTLVTVFGRPGGMRRRDLAEQEVADAPANFAVAAAAFAVGAATRTARTLATIWCSALPAATPARIVAKTFPDSSTVQGARCG